MRLQIEEWAEETLSIDAYEMIKDAIVCYNMSVYRPAFLMSYLAVQAMIRGRLESANGQNVISDTNQNEDTQKLFKNDDKWEALFNTLVFNGTKKEAITATIVENYWSYIQEFFEQHYVIDDKKYLLEKFMYIYKFYYKVEENELNKILQKIVMVYQESVIVFFREVHSIHSFGIPMEEMEAKFWNQVISFKNINVRNALIDFLYEDRTSFLCVFQSIPKVFALMAIRHNDFINEYLTNLFESENFVSECNHVFWKLLVKILGYHSELIDMKKITNNDLNFNDICNIDLDPLELYELQKHNVWKQFLHGAGKAYFCTDSYAIYNYYTTDSGIKDSSVETCFQIMDFDMEVIDQLENACTGLEESMKSWSNEDFTVKGMIRKSSYDHVIRSSSKKIMAVLETLNRTISEYPYTKSLIKN